tara:strand:+ start:13340 stop:14119 length:780 start_codon:yes stop_codon:yes gene_type:complete
MAKQAIGVGAAANDGFGDPLRNAMIKVNENFTELYDGQFDGVYSSLTASPTNLLYWVNDGANNQVLTTNGNGVLTFQDPVAVVVPDVPKEEFELVDGETFGQNNSSNIFIPLVHNSLISNTMVSALPVPVEDLNSDGNIEKIIWTQQLERYTSGGEIILSFSMVGSVDDVAEQYSTKKFLFSRVNLDAVTEDFNMVETSVGSDELCNGVRLVERNVGGNLFLDLVATSPSTGVSSTEFVRVIGQITYTSVPIFVTASGY